MCSRYTNFSGPPTTGPFTKHDLDLPDILRLDGYLIHNAGEATRIWPDAPPAAVEAERYGLDEDHTYQLHADHDAWARTRPADESAAFPDLPGLAAYHYQRWQHTVELVQLLRYGVLIHLECKSAEVNVRDLDARIFRLQQTSSRVARLAVVLPLFTPQVGATWFHHLCHQRHEIEVAGLSVLPFTWPGQPATYNSPGFESADAIPCPTFEAALEELLARYRAT